MVFELLREMLTETLGCDEEEITLTAELRCDLGASDGQIREVADAMSTELGFRYEESDLEDLTTVAQLVRYIAGLL